MAEIWRSGVDKSLERAVIGRRASETEVDLLMLLEVDAPEAERVPITLEQLPDGAAQGEPSRSEMLDALTDWIKADVRPKASGRDRFMASVALNALGMLRRESDAGVEPFDRALAAELLKGQQSLETPGLLARLRRHALAKLAVDQPHYSALASARSLWIGSILP
jgi:hypothetical protein